MAEVTLGDYTGFILLEIIKARELADAYSQIVASRYSADPILQHFPVPRFRVPKMELIIPVLISGARFTQVVRFAMSEGDFRQFTAGHVEDSRNAVAYGQGVLRRFGRSSRGISPALYEVIDEFYRDLVDNPNRLSPDNIVNLAWSDIFRKGLDEVGLLDEWKKQDPNGEFLTKKTRQVLDGIHSATVVDRTTIDSLLINPETNVVRNGSTDATVFTLKAELLEEGFTLRSVTNEDGTVTPIVEFE